MDHRGRTDQATDRLPTSSNYDAKTFGTTTLDRTTHSIIYYHSRRYTMHDCQFMHLQLNAVLVNVVAPWRSTSWAGTPVQ
jgi:hypothetical protein